MIKFVSDLRQVGSFVRLLLFPPPIKTDRHDITDKVLIVELNTITLTLNSDQHYNSYNGFQGIVIWLYWNAVCDTLYVVSSWESPETTVLKEIKCQVDNLMSCRMICGCFVVFYQVLSGDLWVTESVIWHKWMPCCKSWWATCVTRETRRVLLMEQELLAQPKHLRWPPVFSGVCVARSLVVNVLLYRSLIVLLSFFFLPLYYLFFFYLRVLAIPLVPSTFSYVLSLMTYSFIPTFCYIIINAHPLFSSATIYLYISLFICLFLSWL